MITTEEATKGLEQLIVPDSVQKARLTEVVTKITETDYTELINTLLSQAVWVAMKIILALVIYMAGRLLTKWILRILDRSFERRDVEVYILDCTLHGHRSLFWILYPRAAVGKFLEQLYCQRGYYQHD